MASGEVIYTVHVERERSKKRKIYTLSTPSEVLDYVIKISNEQESGAHVRLITRMEFDGLTAELDVSFKNGRIELVEK